MGKMIVHYWSDIMCPFCYLGEQVLARALDRFEHKDQVHVRWKSSILHPEMEIGKSVPFVDQMHEYRDGGEKLNKKIAKLKEMAEKEGLEYGLEKAKIINSTHVARVMKLATDKFLTLEVAKAFGKGYFSDGVDFSDEKEIKRVAVEAGLDGEDVDRVLSSNEYMSEIIGDQAAASQTCPRFIPTVYFNHGFMMDGLLDEDKIVETLQIAYKQWKAFTHQVMTMDHESMGPDECAAICDMPAPY
ncbi:DsbA family protein [Porphyromonas sp.]|uniref:DsbA family oxidoreductase n=1 Tax=Porphyromonas sp. TaxID=1924944 RepID=UPI0026DD5C43|nr:DsbA family protein [Porphyromonas sp.]MDO4695759.1 DsbA family protein [Porphyromonas sp.]MDO4770306.1 DsbA family protein [Porphyromonas sp.]